MCGICGVLKFDRHQCVEREALETMNQQLRHRGPDDAGQYCSGSVGLAMRRLSIIDVKSGHQPVSNEDGTVWIVYNGEIYNHLALRTQLEARGHQYCTKSDTETIVHLYEEYGRDCVRYLRGMFAFAIWDERRRCLFAARDRVGIKPFYYHYSSDRFLFASEIKAILTYPDMHAALNLSAVPEYLAFGYLAGKETMFAEICKLLPGQTLEIDETRQLNIETYWDLPANNQSKPEREGYYIESYRGLLEGAVSSHLMSEVPVGVFLSGGLDSSAVAALMARVRREPIETFSVGYDEAPYSELEYARSVAKHIRSIHHEVRVSKDQFFEALPKLIWHEDEPLVWPSSVALFFVAKLARERVTVVLTGEGSDETLAGYSRYAWTVWNARLDAIYRALTTSKIRHGVRDFIADSSLLNADLRRKLQHSFLGKDGSSWASFYFDNFYAAFSAADQSYLLSEDLQRRGVFGDPYKNSLTYWEKSRGDLIARLLYTDIKTYLVELCMKQDNMSMAASIESRVPFLDHILVEFAATIPSRYNMRGLAGKRILKMAVADLLPRAIIYRPKMGFPTPFRRWLMEGQVDWIEQLLLAGGSLSSTLFKAAAVKRLFAEHKAKRVDHYERIWRILNLELWHRIFMAKDYDLVEKGAVAQAFR